MEDKFSQVPERVEGKIPPSGKGLSLLTKKISFYSKRKVADVSGVIDLMRKR